jgi:NAD+ kinase
VKIGIVAKPHNKDFAAILNQVVQWLQSRDCKTVVEESIVQAPPLDNVLTAPREKIPELVDVIVVFGGDGTMLSVARSIQGRNTQILGVNVGSLGFLTETTLDELYPVLERLLAGKHTTDRRSMLKIEVHHSNGTVGTYHALNDIVINKGTLARVISMDAFVNEDFIANFLADGMIISTPTGSTAYSLSAGGPVLYPTLDSVVMTPICSHTLTNRPLVIPAENSIRVVVKSGEDVMLTVDGQVGVALIEGEEIRCTRSEYQIDLIQHGDKSFFDVLREKFKWGER